MTKIHVLLSNSLNAIKESVFSLMNHSKRSIVEPSDMQVEESDERTELENVYGHEDCQDQYISYANSDAFLQNSLNMLNVSPSISEALNEACLYQIADIECRSKHWLRCCLDELSSDELEELFDALKDRGIILEEYSMDEYLDLDISQLELSSPTYSALESCGLRTVSDLVIRSPYWLLKNIDSFNQNNIYELSSELKRINLSLAEINEEEFVEFKRLQNLDTFIEEHLIGEENLLKSKFLNISNDFLDEDIEYFDFSLRTYNCLRRAGISTVRDLASHSKASLAKIRSINDRILDEIYYNLDLIDLSLDDENELDKLEVYLNNSSKLELIRKAQCQLIQEKYDSDYENFQHEKYDKWHELKKICLDSAKERETNKKEVTLLRANPPSLQKLKKLIGLECVKEQVSDVISHSVIDKSKSEVTNQEFMTPFNMVFTGNPGTGKTTVAKIIAEIFKDLSLLKKGHLVTATRADLVAEYSGQTADKTTEVFNSALDGILFIDEAYSLFYEGCSPKDYGVEVINTLTGLMTENIGRCCVILAGYPEEMEYLLRHSNPGFRDRFPYIINFDDYDQKSLEQIFRLKLKQRNLKLDKSCHQILKNHITQIYEHRDQNFSNGRMVENYLQRIVLNQERRLFSLWSSGKDLTNHDLFTLKSIDFNDVLERFIKHAPETVNTPPMGFVSPSLANSY